MSAARGWRTFIGTLAAMSTNRSHSAINSGVMHQRSMETTFSSRLKIFLRGPLPLHRVRGLRSPSEKVRPGSFLAKWPNLLVLTTTLEDASAPLSVMDRGSTRFRSRCSMLNGAVQRLTPVAIWFWPRLCAHRPSNSSRFCDACAGTRLGVHLVLRLGPLELRSRLRARAFRSFAIFRAAR